MELFKIRKDIAFMKHALVLNAFSFITFLAAVFFLFHKGIAPVGRVHGRHRD
jgi:preprotein translocase subunit SecF